MIRSINVIALRSKQGRRMQAMTKLKPLTRCSLTRRYPFYCGLRGVLTCSIAWNMVCHQQAASVLVSIGKPRLHRHFAGLTALGRLVMFLTDSNTIKEVLCFPGSH